MECKCGGEVKQRQLWYHGQWVTYCTACELTTADMPALTSDASMVDYKRRMRNKAKRTTR